MTTPAKKPPTPYGTKTTTADQEALLTELLADWQFHPAGTDRWRSMCPFGSHGQGNPEVFMTFRRGNFRCYRCAAEGDIVKGYRADSLYFTADASCTRSWDVMA